MKPEFYNNYAEYMDYINDLGISLSHILMLAEVKKHIKDGDKIVDIGGGTGLFTSHILKLYPNLKLTFIEPSFELLLSAKKKLPETSLFINKTVSDSLPLIQSNQNVFLFFRSLYAIVKQNDELSSLLIELYCKLEENGKIIIYDFCDTFEINNSFKNYFRNLKVKSPKDEIEFEKFWEMHQKMIQKFSEGVNNGEFKVFTKKELISIFKANNFESVHYESVGNRYIAVFQKVIKCNHP